MRLIAGDQITDDAILRCPVPDRARPILRALEDRHEPVLEVPWRAPTEPVDDRAPQNDDFAVALGWALRAEEILELKRGAYRATSRLYSSFRATTATGRRH